MIDKVELDEKAYGFTERSVHSKALLNTDLDSLLRYKIKKQKMISQNNEMVSMKAEIENFRTDLSEIRELIQQLLRK
jgi:hypothetical protein